MSLEPVLVRIAQIESAIADPTSLAGSTAGASTPAASVASAPVASATGSFASLLGSATGSLAAQAATVNSAYGMAALSALSNTGGSTGASGLDPASALLSLIGGNGTSATSPTAPGTAAYPGVSAGGNQQIVQIAESQVGQTEQPPGSNDGPAIAMYRSAVAGSQPGEPWCAYFASWVARQAGVPVGDQGQGLGAVSEIWSWAQQTGRAIPNGPGVVPQPGDLIVFGDQHVGIVVGVQPNGSIDTVEGNFDNQVARNVRSPTEATGYVNMSG
jgi:hypothetical protein